MRNRRLYETEKIKFYEGSYYLLSNFSAHKVEYKGVLYMTAEHAYQVAKFKNPIVRKKIKEAPSAYLAREYGQLQTGRKENFDKVTVMKEIMRAKLCQHRDVRELLRQTGNAEIEKNHPDDYFWGTGTDSNGQNIMGKIWMELRKKL
ncbi:NADAR family protein [Patescibacteria group bacterium]|nr:MAG: NADAR family protein [Patescibacteria group bacterium]